MSDNSNIQLSEEQNQALQLMLSGKNVFLTGEAGTGKSTVLRQFRAQCTRECVFLAPTGIAAINVQGATLHSFFLLKPGLLTPEAMEEIDEKAKALFRYHVENATLFAKAKAIHQSSVILDSHTDTPMIFPGEFNIGRKELGDEWLKKLLEPDEV